ncbi:unnamed protein product [Caenorhabditis brenneri]
MLPPFSSVGNNNLLLVMYNLLMLVALWSFRVSLRYSREVRDLNYSPTSLAMLSQEFLINMRVIWPRRNVSPTWIVSKIIGENSRALTDDQLEEATLELHRIGCYSPPYNSFDDTMPGIDIIDAQADIENLMEIISKFTEIDWSTYMQQVECYSKKGILNYTNIGGDTGPVVYPAGQIFAYRILHFLTSSGRNIRLAQHIFQCFHLFNIFMVFRILQKTMRVPPIVLLLVTITGYRIHSIFMLRLFNDPLAMMLFYVAMDRFLNEKWLVGCILYSVAVSIKMNVLLFAPAMFFTLILNNSYLHTLGYLALCGVIQLYIGSPFLLYDCKSYVQRSFDLGRVFMFKWTVNWRFLPEEVCVL